jgi:hypothetical protein
MPRNIFSEFRRGHRDAFPVGRLRGLRHGFEHGIRHGHRQGWDDAWALGLVEVEHARGYQHAFPYAEWHGYEDTFDLFDEWGEESYDDGHGPLVMDRQ